MVDPNAECARPPARPRGRSRPRARPRSRPATRTATSTPRPTIGRARGARGEGRGVSGARTTGHEAGTARHGSPPYADGDEGPLPEPRPAKGGRLRSQASGRSPRPRSLRAIRGSRHGGGPAPVRPAAAAAPGCGSRCPRRSTRWPPPPSPVCRPAGDAARPRCWSPWSRTDATAAVFDGVFDAFFALLRSCRPSRPTALARARRPVRRGRAGGLHPVRGARRDPGQGHSHGKPAEDIRDYFDPDDLAQQYNLHQEANKIDLAAMTDEIVLSTDQASDAGRGRPGADRRRPSCTARAAGRRPPTLPAAHWRSTSSSPSPRRMALLGWLAERGRRARR